MEVPPPNPLRRRPGLAGGLVPIAAVLAAVLITDLTLVATHRSHHRSPQSDAFALSVTTTACAPEWKSSHGVTETFAVTNRSGLPGEIELDDASDAIVAQVLTLAPDTTVELSATLGDGDYSFRCRLVGRPLVSSQPVIVSGRADVRTTAVAGISVADLTPANNRYIAYASAQLGELASDVATIDAALQADDVEGAQQSWLPAQLDWERVGASYDSFGVLGLAVDGLPDGYPDGVSDPGFTGLHRLEYGLWHGQSAAQLQPVADALETAIAKVRAGLRTDDEAGDPTNLPVRAHEILEDALRDHLSGIDDEGAGAAYAETYADTQVTLAILGYLSPLIAQHSAIAGPQLHAELARLERALLATRAAGQWRAPSATPMAEREQVDSAIGAALQTLSLVPDQLTVTGSG